MGVGGCKKALYSNQRIHFLGKAGKLTTVHFAAYKFAEPALQPGFLRGAGRYRYEHFIIGRFDPVTDQDAPGEIAQGLHKARQALTADVETGPQVFGGHAGDPAPDSFIDPFGGGLIELFGYVDEPEGIYDTVMPEKKLNIPPQLRRLHFFEDLKIHCRLTVRLVAHLLHIIIQKGFQAQFIDWNSLLNSNNQGKYSVKHHTIFLIFSCKFQLLLLFWKCNKTHLFCGPWWAPPGRV